MALVKGWTSVRGQMMTLTSKPAEKPVYKIDSTRAHQVYKNAAGKRVPGVTTILGLIAKPALVHWAWQMGSEGKDYKKVSEQAAGIGTIAHAMCECHVKGMELDTSNLSKEDLDKAETAFIKFVSWWDSNGFKCIASELQMVSEYYQCGGTADIIARDRDGKLVLIDLKTSKAIYSEHRVQTSVYAEMYEETHSDPIDRVLIARIGKEDAGDFEWREVHDRRECQDYFEALCDAYRLKKAVKD